MNPPRNLDTRHLFTPPSSRRAWESRARALRQRVLFASGLWPMPPKTPLTPRTTATFEQDGVVVENVAIQTLPGFWLCGNVYRPAGPGPFPAIVNPHGHWANGRKEREGDVPKAAAPPAPPAPGKADLVALAANLARQGFLVFAYDMVGYNETDQVKHRHFGVTPESWLWAVSELGLQTWNSIRAVDYLSDRKDVDAKRIGATGASGGGTQVFLLAAVDERIQVSVPVNMVSAIMQGGCICENAPALRVGTDNPEIAAVFAPKPQLLVSCTGDWTRNNPTDEGPTIRRVYDLYGAGDRLQVVQFNYQHNYNVESREAMSAFFRRWLMEKRAVSESPIGIAPEKLTVARPAGKSEDEVAASLRSLFDTQVRQLRERGSERGRETLRVGLAVALAVETPAPPRRRGAGRAALVVGADGDPKVAATVAALGARGISAEALTLPAAATDRNALWKDFHTTYNRTPLGDRVQAVLDAIVRKAGDGAGTVDVVGVGAGGAWALLARALAPTLAAGALCADMDAFPVDDDRAYVERCYAPGLRRVGDLRTAAALAAVRPVLLHGLGAPAASWERAGLRGDLHLEERALTPAEAAVWTAGG